MQISPASGPLISKKSLVTKASQFETRSQRIKAVVLAGFMPRIPNVTKRQTISLQSVLSWSLNRLHSSPQNVSSWQVSMWQHHGTNLVIILFGFGHGQTFGGHSRKINSAHILMLGRP